MGLAASQARFLALTSRKADCEYQSMQLAQQKLSISRDLTKASEDYEEAMNATNLVWDSSGKSTASGALVDEYTTDNSTTKNDLSYDLMMKPTILNGYDPYFLTNPQGQIVLNSEYAAAATAAGIEKTGNPSRSEDGFKKFVKALNSKGIISDPDYDSITQIAYTDAKGNQHTNYQVSAGMGADPLDKSTANTMSLANLIEYLDGPDFYLKLTDIDSDNDGKGDISELAASSFKDGEFSCTVGSSSQNINMNELKELTVADLLNTDYVIAYGGKKGGTSVSKFTEAFIARLSKLLGYDPSSTAKSYYALYNDGASQNALISAYQTTLTEFSTANQSKVKNGKAIDYNTILVDDHFSTKYTGVSLTNIVNAFLTNYAQALTGYQGKYSVGQKVNNSNYVTDDDTYQYLTYNDGSIASEPELLKTDFYSIMYNNICENGWTENDKVDDNKYIDNALKSSQLFISSLNADDGYYYQDAYTANGYVKEVTDTDAIARAEVEYNTVKSRLNYKEENIDLKAKQLDLEISSITTEYDTVKNLISKNVEKTFTMFSS